MKNLLFLAGLIMVTAACSSGSSSNTSGTNMTVNEDSRKANVSLVYLGLSGNSGAPLYSLCETSYNASTQELRLEISGVKDDTLTYSLSEIKEEYVDLVKKNKVSVKYEYDEYSYNRRKYFQPGKFFPVVLKKAPAEMFPPDNFWHDGELRRFRYECILKNSVLEGSFSYDVLYHGAFLYGGTKVGNQIMQNGRCFFSLEDFEPEITSEDVFGKKGIFSAGLANYSPLNDFCEEDRYGTYRYGLVQVLYENNELIIRVQDGKTFRYPASYFHLATVNTLEQTTNPLLVHNQCVPSAVQILNGNWIPVFIHAPNSDAYRYSSCLWFADQNHFQFFKHSYDLKIYLKFMQYSGFEEPNVYYTFSEHK